MFHSFTASAQRVLKRADLLTRRRDGALVEPLDLLAALALESDCQASELLTQFGVETARLWAAMSAPAWKALESAGSLGKDELSTDDSTSEPLPHSINLRAVLNEAALSARGLNRKNEVGTQHLLAGLLAASSDAADLLREAGLEYQALFENLVETMTIESGPLPPALEIPPLDLAEPGGGVDLGRILDASANRAREGLRVVEDYVRFVLDDPGLTRRLKEVRHRFAEAERGLDANLLLDSRDTSEDVGTHIMTPSEQLRENPRAVLTANFKRIAEALRSLEEYSKLVDIWLAGRFEVLRYDIYTIEKLTMTAVSAYRGLGNAAVMVLVGGMATMGDLTWIVEEALAGGADCIQLREKRLSDREFLTRARELRILTAKAGVPLIVNDRVDIARLARADGVHVGQDDLAVRDARRILGGAAHIGVSTHDRAQFDAAILAGASYLGVGPVFPSPTKSFSEPELAGLALVRLAAESTTLPWFAIGGINEGNVARALEAGATRIAVSSAVVRATRPRRAVQALKARMQGLTLDPEPADRPEDE
jgi:thiamine-phosphate pyrophosphorylase